MAMFTTTIQTILRTIDDSHDINKQLDTGVTYLFDDSWQLNDADNTQRVKKMILRHYYMREIGYETPELFKLKLNTTLAEIAPKYTMLYNSIEVIRDKLFNNIDVTETQTASGKGVTDATGSSESKSKTTDTSTSSNTSNGTSSGSGNSDAWQTANDTPQGALTGLENNQYLSSATHNKGTTDQATETSSNTSATGSGTTDNTATASNTTNTTATTSSEYIKKIIGKNTSENYIDIYNKLNNNLLNIDLMLINEIEPLFMGLWE